MSDKNSDKNFDFSTKDMVLISVSSAAIHITSWLYDKMSGLGSSTVRADDELPKAKKPSALFKVYVLRTASGAYFGTFSTRASAEERRDELFEGGEDSLSQIVIEELEVQP